MITNTKAIIKYNPDAFLEYIKNKHMDTLINKMDNINININECMLCKKLKQKLGKNTWVNN